jgi:phytoene synthase
MPKVDPNPAEPAQVAAWRFPNPATPAGSTAYYSIRVAPPELHDALAVLFGWRAEVQSILEQVSDHGVARLKLDWWRSEARGCAEGAPRHPLSRLLAPIMAAHALPLDPFLGMAEGVEDELRGHRAPDAAAQQQAAEKDLGGLFELILRCHGVTSEQSVATARRIGGWSARVRRARDGGLLLRQARAVVPEDRLAAVGLDHEALSSRAQRHRLPALLTATAADLTAERPVTDETRTLPPTLRVQARIHDALLTELI